MLLLLLLEEEKSDNATKRNPCSIYILIITSNKVRIGMNETRVNASLTDCML